jgi:hypothetical protein
MYKIETSGDLGQGWPTTNSWEKMEREEERRIPKTVEKFHK